MLIKDPVCGMSVPPEQLRTTHLQMSFAFCSEQCRERFLANPHLYIGLPGHKAPKQIGTKVLKHRRLRLDQPLTPDQAQQLTQALLQMMGVRWVKAEGERVEIRYDLIEATAEQLETQIAEIGAELGSGWLERLHRAFIHFEEESEVASLEVHEDRTRGP
jgi:YHS domain-containing protein